MIQRIQTLFLLLVSFLLSVLFFFPLTVFTVKGEEVLLSSGGIIQSSIGEFVVWSLIILLSIMVALPLITIFFYKKRMLQIRLTVFSTVLDFLFLGLVWYESDKIAKLIQAEVVSYNWYLLPLLAGAVILNILAIKRIGRDEMLIRSLNSSRIR